MNSKQIEKIFITLWFVGLAISLIGLFIVARYDGIKNNEYRQAWLTESYTMAKKSPSGQVKRDGCLITYIEDLDDINIAFCNMDNIRPK